MKFGSFTVTEADGVILAHTFRAAGLTLKKGTIIGSGEIAALVRAGAQTVMGARLEPGDMGEDAAAARVAACVAGGGVRLTESHTGRCNLVAVANGITLVDEHAITAANLVDESVTVATLADKVAVRAGQTLATVKIIPFAVSSDVMTGVERALPRPSVRVIAYQPKRVSLINTTLPGLKPSVIASTTQITRERIEAVGGQLVDVRQTAHAQDAVEATLRDALASSVDVVLIAGASATVDRGDVVPAAIEAVGGTIEHFGMPVDPGNLLVLARIGPVPVIILPGCARSHKLNGFDWVLQRLAANVAVTRTDIMRMGAGGLLVDTPTRPLPRDVAVTPQTETPAAKVAAVVLAAGQSRRMGGPNKLLLDVGGQALIRRTVETIRNAGIGDIVVVTGHQSELVSAALQGLSVRCVHNPDFADGLSTSLRVGLGVLDPACDAALICLGDMPLIGENHIRAVIDGFRPEADKLIGVPTHRGKRGNPVLWARRFFDEMGRISGDTGARHLIGTHESLVYEVEFDDTGVITDLDTAEQWQRFRAERGPD